MTGQAGFCRACDPVAGLNWSRAPRRARRSPTTQSRMRKTGQNVSADLSVLWWPWTGRSQGDYFGHVEVVHLREMRLESPLSSPRPTLAVWRQLPISSLLSGRGETYEQRHCLPM